MSQLFTCKLDTGPLAAILGQEQPRKVESKRAETGKEKANEVS